MAKESEKNTGDGTKKRFSWRRFGNVLFSILFALVLLLVGVLLYSKFTGKRVLRYELLWVMTSSMENAIPQQSYILTETVSPDEVQVGDVITFRSRDPVLNGDYNTHRVVEILGDHAQFHTQGDNPVTNSAPDRYLVEREDVVAKYVRNMPLITVFGRFFATKLGIVVVLLFILFDIGAWFFLNLSRSEKKKSKERRLQALIDEEVRRLEQEAAQTEITGGSNEVPPSDPPSDN